MPIFCCFILEFVMSFLKKLAANKRGATAIEYALIAGLIAVASVAAFTAVGGGITTKVGQATAELT
jgi:pilus assembly protein Flp/PilA